MRSASRKCPVIAMLAGGSVLLGLGSTGVSGAAAWAWAATAANPPKVVMSVRISRRPGELPSGTRVSSASIFSQRVFTDAEHGFALSSSADADYAVTTSDGGKSWRTAGPALHLHAAQAPAAVSFVGAVTRRLAFAWGGGQVIDTTSDGGRTWYRGLFPTVGPVAVVGDHAGHLLAFVGSPSGSVVYRYTSRDRGRTWRYQRTVAR